MMRTSESGATNQLERIQELIDQLEGHSDPEVRKMMSACLVEVLTLHGAAISRILEIVGDEKEGSHEIYERILDEADLRGVLLIHGLHPLDLETRLRLTLDRIRPEIQKQSGEIEVVTVRNGSVHLRVIATRKEGLARPVALEAALRKALSESCPDLVEIQVEGIPKRENGNGLRILMPDEMAAATGGGD